MATSVFLIVDLLVDTEGYAMTKHEKTTRGCDSKIVDDYIPGLGCPHTFLSDRGT